MILNNNTDINIINNNKSKKSNLNGLNYENITSIESKLLLNNFKQEKINKKIII